MPACELRSGQLAEFADFIREMTGISFDATNWVGLKVSLRERMEDRAVPDAEAYLSLLKADGAEVEELIALICIPETYFFRDKRQFQALRDDILPEIVSRKQSVHPGVRPLVRIVSCGCSTGQEPYSIAIAIDQSGLSKEADFEITAFDINKKSVFRAREGVYTRHSFREPNTEEIMRFFYEKGAQYFLADPVKRMVQLECANLFHLKASSVSLKGADVIFFRNVGIYFDGGTRARAVRLFEENISAGGYLFLGSAESLSGMNTRFVLEEIREAYVWKAVQRAGKGTDRKARESNGARPPAYLNFPKRANRAVPEKPRQEEFSHYENGVGYLKIRMPEKAEAEFKEQLRLTPRHVSTMASLAGLYADRGLDDRAIEICRGALKLDNLLSDVHFTLGTICFKKRDAASAVSEFKKTLYCDETHFLAQYCLALCYQMQGSKEEAQRTFEVTAEAIRNLGPDGLKKEIGCYTGGYILNLCMDNLVHVT